MALAALLAGYMFLGRGFAHVGVPPIYVGEVVLFIGLIATAIAFVRLRLRVAPSRLVWVLIVFMVLGAARTIPYLAEYRTDALRDGVLWGYAAFALMIYVLADRAWVLGAMRSYGWVVPIFAVWLPILWFVFQTVGSQINPDALGSDVPLLYFKLGDMAVHATGSIAFLVLGTSVITIARTFAWRALIALPLTWTIFVASTGSRGALGAAAAGLGVVALLAQRTRNWLPVLASVGVLAVVLLAPGPFRGAAQLAPTPQPTPIASGVPSPSGPSIPSPSGPSIPSPSSVPQPTPSFARQVEVSQIIDNITSIFSSSSDGGLEGTKAFRLAWWTKIVDYTVFGRYFWTGKGFGVNLADDDGFQPNADHSLRAPHNSSISVLARMGVPGFVLWVLLQGAFAIGLLRSVLAHRQAGDLKVAAVGAWILVYWTAMMVVTSFDPYLEGPQGGIWFWTLFGLGLVVMRLTPRRAAA